MPRASKAPRTDLIERLYTTVLVQSAQIAELQISNDELRAVAGLAPLKPKIEPANYRTVQQVAGMTGYSPSNIRKLIDKGILTKIDGVGGRVLIEASSIPNAKRITSAKRRVERTPQTA